MQYKRVVGMGAVALAIAGVMAASPAAAATTLVVDDTAPGGCNGMTAMFTSIQAAVTVAMPGDTVLVCPGNYAENVTVNKSLTIDGAQHGVDGRTRNTSNEAVVNPADANSTPTFSLNADNITLDGFFLTGNENGPAVYTSPSSSGYRVKNNRIVANAFGVYFNANGNNPSVVNRNAITGNNENLGVAPAAGNGIYSDQGLSGALIQSNKFRNNINGANLIAGPASGVTASGNNSSADGTFFAAFTGSGFRVLYNSVTRSNGSAVFFGDIGQGGPAPSGILVQKNKLWGNVFSGIAIRTGVSGASVLGNTTSYNGDQGISVSSAVPGAVNVRNNTANFNKGDGIQFSMETKGNIIRYNQARGNGNFDCEDQSRGSGTAGTANFWSQNTGVTSSPRRLCKPPTNG